MRKHLIFSIVPLTLLSVCLSSCSKEPTFKQPAFKAYGDEITSDFFYLRFQEAFLLTSNKLFDFNYRTERLLSNVRITENVNYEYGYFDQNSVLIHSYENETLDCLASISNNSIKSHTIIKKYWTKNNSNVSNTNSKTISDNENYIDLNQKLHVRKDNVLDSKTESYGETGNLFSYFNSMSRIYVGLLQLNIYQLANPAYQTKRNAGRYRIDYGTTYHLNNNVFTISGYSDELRKYECRVQIILGESIHYSIEVNVGNSNGNRDYISASVTIEPFDGNIKPL